MATLRFEGVDYFAKVWLNGTLLGEHEGYADPFGFEVGPLPRMDEELGMRLCWVGEK
jgi:beta-mannosidase